MPLLEKRIDTAENGLIQIQNLISFIPYLFKRWPGGTGLR